MSSNQLLRRVVAGVVVLVATAALPCAAEASCSTSWLSATSGSFTDAANWDNGVPGSGSDACITVDGTYTVSVSTSVTVNSLTLGGTTGVQTLSVASTCAAYALLTATAESTCSEYATTSKSGNLTNAGTITLKNADGCGYNASLLLAGGTLTNKGTLEALAGAGGQRLIDASISNAKTIIARAGATLHVTGTYTQTAPGTFTPEIDSASRRSSAAPGSER